MTDPASFLVRSLPLMLAVGALACTLSGGGTSSEIADRSSLRRCDRLVWAPAETIRTARGFTVAVELPQVVEVDSGTLVIGSYSYEMNRVRFLVPLGSDPSAYFGAGILLGLDGVARSIPMPVAAREIGVPRVARREGEGGGGGVTVVWGADDSFSDPRELYAADLLDAGWTPPERISDVQQNWSPITPSALVSVPGELRLVAAPLRGPTGGMLIRRSAAGWSSTPLPLDLMHGYTRLVPLPGDTLVVVLVAAGEPDGNTLYMRRVTTTGTLIGERVRISEPGGGAVHDPELIAIGDTLLYLVWSRRIDGRLAERLELAASGDGGQTWTALPGTRTEAPFDMIHAAADARGRLHVAVRGDSLGHPNPLHLFWGGSAWHAVPVPRVAGGMGAGHPFMMLRDPDAPRIAWSSVDARYWADGLADLVYMPLMVASRGRYDCSTSTRREPRAESAPGARFGAPENP